jgi:hypothetical protein
MIMKIMTLGGFKDSFKKLFKDRKSKMLVMAGIAGILLLFVGDIFGSGAGKTQSIPEFDNDAYNAQFVEKTMQDLYGVISKIEGVGEVEIAVTLETGVQYEYAANSKTTSDGTSQKSSSEHTLITVDGKNGKEPIVLKRIEPTIKGVVVVCTGADNIYVKQAVIDIATTLCGISANRVSVAKLVTGSRE